MSLTLDKQQISFLRQAIHLAEEAERSGSLPIGAVIALDGEVIAQGMNAIWTPSLSLTRHAEMEALRAVPSSLWARSTEMTLYTTLEPCLMCAGAILLHGIGHLIFGSADPYGGVSACLGALPPFFGEVYAQTAWIGPALPAECDPLYRRVHALEHRRTMESACPGQT